MTIQNGNYCDLARGVEEPNESGGGDFKFERETKDVAVLYPSSRSAFSYLEYQGDKHEFENLPKKVIETREYREGLITFPKAYVPNKVGLAPGETDTYQIRGTYYGALRVESVQPDLVISFVTYKAVTVTASQVQTPKLPSDEGGALERGTVTIQKGNYCDLARGVEEPNESGGGDLKFERETNDVSVLYPSSRSAFSYLGYQGDKHEFENVPKKVIETRKYREGLITFPKAYVSNKVGLAPGETYTYQIRGTYYGALRVEWYNLTSSSRL